MISVEVLGVGQGSAGQEVKLRLTFAGDEPLDVDQITRIVSEIRFRVDASAAGRRGARLRLERGSRPDKDAPLRDPVIVECRHLYETTDKKLTAIAREKGIAYGRLHGIKQRYGWQRATAAA